MNISALNYEFDWSSQNKKSPQTPPLFLFIDAQETISLLRVASLSSL